MNGREYTYSVVYDAEAAKRFDKAAIRRSGFAWLGYFLLYAYRFALVGLLMAGAFFLLLREEVSLAVAVALTVAFGGVFGGIWMTLSSLQAGQESRDDMNGVSWECTITDEAFIQTDSDGTATHYPWNTLRLAYQHPDGFLLDTSRGQILIDRKPLVDAGLEEMFLSRIASGGTDSV
jgi:hypothetical protein